MAYVNPYRTRLHTEVAALISDYIRTGGAIIQCPPRKLRGNRFHYPWVA